MTAARKPRRGVAISTTIAASFADCERPNDVWCMDFKGWFHTHDSIKCYPSTLIDAFSRMVPVSVWTPGGPVAERASCALEVSDGSTTAQQAGVEADRSGVAAVRAA
jgi:transposase InsO family protein